MNKKTGAVVDSNAHREPCEPCEPCELCNHDGGEILFRHPDYRIVRVMGEEGAAYRGFCRVIWQHHVKEMSDLNTDDRSRFMDAVFRLEAALREVLQPEKINLASLGNMTPHLHWHVIPRYRDDFAFPKPIWAVAGTTTATATLLPSPPPLANSDWVATVRKTLSP